MTADLSLRLHSLAAGPFSAGDEVLIEAAEEIERLRKRAKCLHDALRHEVIHSGTPGHKWCRQCGSFWRYGEPEQHERGCLAEELK